MEPNVNCAHGNGDDDDEQDSRHQQRAILAPGNIVWKNLNGRK